MKVSHARLNDQLPIALHIAVPWGSDIFVPCNEHGVVDLDQLGDEERQAYFFAHVLVGREFAKPVVCCSGEVSQSDFGQPGVASMP